MLTVIMSLFIGTVSSSTVHPRQYDATRPTVTYRGQKSVKAYNWWNERPNGKLFAADETCEFQVQPKGGL